MLTQGKEYEFIQLTRQLDGPGTLSSGTFDYRFQFKNVDLDVDSYYGIVLDVKYEVYAEMIYQGSVMNYTVKTTQIFSVRNNRDQASQAKDGEASEADKLQMQQTRTPRLRIEFQGFRDCPKPVHMELYLHQTNLNIDRESLTGYLRMKQIAEDIRQRIRSVKIQLV